MHHKCNLLIAFYSRFKINSRKYLGWFNYSDIFANPQRSSFLTVSHDSITPSHTSKSAQSSFSQEMLLRTAVCLHCTCLRDMWCHANNLDCLASFCRINQSQMRECRASRIYRIRSGGWSLSCRKLLNLRRTMERFKLQFFVVMFCCYDCFVWSVSAEASEVHLGECSRGFLVGN